MARPWDLGPRVQDFSALANLGSQFTGAYDAARKRVREEDDQAIFATAAQGGDLNKLGMALLGRGRVQEGAALLSLGQKAAEKQAESEWFRGVGGGGSAAPASPAAAIPVVAAPKQGVHVAENEDDVQRLERATGMVTTDADRQAIVKTVYGEAANQPAVGQQAVAAVIRNRANQAGLTPEQITQQRNQFEPWNTEAGRARMNSIPEARFAQIAGTVAPVIEQGLDPTGGATHFYAPKAQAALGRPAPRWDNGTGSDIADHRFFNLGYGKGGGVPAPAPQAIIAGAPGQAPTQTAQAAPQTIPGDDPVRLRQEAEYYARSNPEAARQLSARADAAERGGGAPVQVAQAPAQPGDPRADQLPVGGSPAQGFIIPGASPQQVQSIRQDPQVQYWSQMGARAPSERARAYAKQQMDLAVEDAKRRSEGDKPTEQSRNFEAYRREELAAGREPLSRLEFLKAQRTTINNTNTFDGKGENKFNEALGAAQAKRWNGYIEEGDVAQGRLADIQTLRETSRRLGSQGSSANLKATIGPYAESLGIKVDGLPDIQLYESITNRLAPTLRAPGSGSTSDIEFKGFQRAIGPLSNNPAAREMILDTFEAASRNDVVRAQIASRLASGEINRGDAEKELRALPNPLQAFREFRKANPDLVGQAIKDAAASAKDGAAGADAAKPKDLPKVASPDEAKRLPSGTEFIDPNGIKRRVP